MEAPRVERPEGDTRSGAKGRRGSSLAAGGGRFWKSWGPSDRFDRVCSEQLVGAARAREPRAQEVAASVTGHEAPTKQGGNAWSFLCAQAFGGRPPLKRGVPHSAAVHRSGLPLYGRRKDWQEQAGEHVHVETNGSAATRPS